MQLCQSIQDLYLNFLKVSPPASPAPPAPPPPPHPPRPRYPRTRASDGAARGAGGAGQERLNRTLYTLTGVWVLAMPAQLLQVTGYFGINLEAMWLLRWEHGHAFFWAVAASTAGSALWFRREAPAPPVRPTSARPRRGAGGPCDDG